MMVMIETLTQGIDEQWLVRGFIGLHLVSIHASTWNVTDAWFLASYCSNFISIPQCSVQHTSNFMAERKWFE